MSADSLSCEFVVKAIEEEEEDAEDEWFIIFISS